MGQKLFQEKFNVIVKGLESTVDGLMKGIDPGIIRTVALFNLAGFPTQGSCEGHLDQGEPFPWVMVSPQTPNEWVEYRNNLTDIYILPKVSQKFLQR